MFNYCQCCAAKLWSEYSKHLGVCPECKNPDSEIQDLESMLESTLNQPKAYNVPTN